MAWEKPVPHHKWKDEIAEEERVKDAKAYAKAEDHTKECPFCYHSPVEAAPQHPGLAADHLHQLPANCYHCTGCERMYLAGAPGTILLHGNPVIVEHGGHNDA